MKTKLFLIFIFPSLLSVKANSTYLHDKEIKMMPEMQNIFAKKFYKSIASNSEGNLFFSPFSIATAMSMLYMGSKGNTEYELKSALNISSDKSALRKEYFSVLIVLKVNIVLFTVLILWAFLFQNESFLDLKKLVYAIFAIPTSNAAVERIFSLCKKQWTDDRNCLKIETVKSLVQKEQSDFELNSANKMYISKEYPILEEFTTSVSNDFLSSITLMNFTEKENARMEINRDIETATHSKIKDLIPDDFLSELTRLVLVNAINFKGMWLHPFKTSDTENKPFWITEYRSVEVPMMTTKNYFRMNRNDKLNSTLLAMDYMGDRLNFIILLPDEINGLKKIEENLFDEDILPTEFERTDARVSIPKFKIEETVDLKEVLEKLGVSDLFSEDRSDLSGVSGRKDLFVSNVLHKAYIDVDEAGTEAAAATVSNVRLKRSLEMPETFVADRPFLFFIHDKILNMILFMGRFTNPPMKRAFTDEL